MNFRLKTVIFSLVPVTLLLLLLEVTGRVLYPFDEDRRAMIMAERSQRPNAEVAEFQRVSAEFAARHGQRDVIVMQPDIYSTGKPMSAEEWATRERFASTSRNLGQVYPQYRGDLARTLAGLPGVAFVDFRGRFYAIAELLSIDDCHTTDGGYNMVAVAITAAVE